MNRREFLGMLGAFAAYAAVPQKVLDIVPPLENNDFDEYGVTVFWDGCRIGDVVSVVGHGTRQEFDVSIDPEFLPYGLRRLKKHIAPEMFLRVIPYDRKNYELQDVGIKSKLEINFGRYMDAGLKGQRLVTDAWLTSEQQVSDDNSYLPKLAQKRDFYFVDLTFAPQGEIFWEERL